MLLCLFEYNLGTVFTIVSNFFGWLQRKVLANIGGRKLEFWFCAVPTG